MEEDKDFNRNIDTSGTAVENINQRLKTYAVLGDVYSGAIVDCHKINKIIQLVSALCKINLNECPVRK